MDWQGIVLAIATRLQSDYVLDACIVVALFALLRTVLLSRRITLLTRGKDGASLESSLTDMHTKLDQLSEHAQKTETALNNLDARMQTALRAVEVQHFDPFQNAGGQQSFSAALLNESGDGVVFSGIHARDGVRVYAKEVHTFTSSRELSNEEDASIAAAKKLLGES